MAVPASAWVPARTYTGRPLTVPYGFFDQFTKGAGEAAPAKKQAPAKQGGGVFDGVFGGGGGGGYVPEGMSAAEYEATKRGDEAKRAASRSKKRGSQMTLDEAVVRGSVVPSRSARLKNVVGR